MRYLELEDIRRQLRLEEGFTEDDNYLTILGDSAEAFMEDYLDYSLDDVAANNGGELPRSLYLALLLFVDYAYDNSGSGEQRDIPNAFFNLARLYKKYFVV